MTQTAEVPLTEHQLDVMLDKLDMDGDGEVDFSWVLATSYPPYMYIQPFIFVTIQNNDYFFETH